MRLILLQTLYIIMMSLTILFPSFCCKTLKMLVFVRTRLFPSLLWLSAV